MNQLIALCIRRRAATVTLSVVALMLAIWGTWNSELDVFPEFVPSQVSIHTDAPGFTAEQVEQLVTHPIEKALNGSEGVSTLRSQSIPGLSVVSIGFANGANLYNSRQDISERLVAVARSLPLGTGTPQLSPLTSGARDLLKVGLISNVLDPYQLREAADYTIKPRLLSLPGVAIVSVFGGKVRQIKIEPDPRKLTAFGFTVADLVRAAPGALALRGAGFIDLSGQRVLIQTPTPSPDVSVIGDGILGVRNGTPIHLRDVASISEEPEQEVGDSLIQGRPGVLLSVSSQYGANTLTTTRAVEKALEELTPELEKRGIALYPALHHPATFIERALAGLAKSLALAAVFIFIALWLFLRDGRSAFIGFVAIPLSLLASTATLNYFGYTLNTMTISGLIVALGVLVDDAVVGIENVLRRLRENTQIAQPRSRTDVIRDASFEVHGPVFYATLVVLAAFVPELLSSDVQGRLVGPLALAFMVAVLASLVVALTIAPALSAILLYPEDAHVDPGWLKALKKLQGNIIEGLYHHLFFAVGSVALLLVASLALLPSIGGSFLPEFRESHLIAQVTSRLPGTSIEEMMNLGGNISSDILKLPYVATVEQQIGRSERTEDTWGPHQCEFQIELRPDRSIDQARAEQDLRAILARYPGIQSEVVTFFGDRISESLTGQTAQVAVKLFGRDLDVLDRTAEKIVQVLKPVDGIVDLQFNRQSGTPVLDVALDPSAIASVGLKGQDVLDTIATDYAGTTVGEAYIGTQTVDVVVQLPKAWRNSPEQLSELTIGGPFGPVPLSSVAHIVPGTSRYNIQHEGGSRMVAVTFNVAGRALQSAVGAAQTAIAEASVIPAGVKVEFAGAAAAEQKTRFELVAYSVLVLVIIVLILFVAFRWRAHTWLVLTNLPFSLIGGILAIAIAGIGLSLGALVGLVTVFGISARNAILQLSYYEQLVDGEGLPWNSKTLIRGANERLTPILMTAVLTGLGLAPLVLSMNQPGQEISGPLAVTVLGGLASSTFLNLILLPALCARYSRAERNVD